MLTACAWRDAPTGPAPVVAGLRTFLGGWLGIGRIVVGMARQSYDLQLTRYGEEGWRATFYPAGRAHSVTSAVGSAGKREPWIAVQRGAWESLRTGGEGSAGNGGLLCWSPTLERVRIDATGLRDEARL
jgi:hypothetical protein